MLSTDLKRMTFSVTNEVEASLKSIKKEMFYRYQSDMRQTLVSSGMGALEIGKTERRMKNEQSA